MYADPLQAYERTINGTDVLDNMELLNIGKYIPEYDSIPRHAIIKAHEAAIKDFSRRCWYDVARKLFVLFALAMELPENYFVERHDYEKPSQDHLRYVSFTRFTKITPSLPLDTILDPQLD